MTLILHIDHENDVIFLHTPEDLTNFMRSEPIKIFVVYNKTLKLSEIDLWNKINNIKHKLVNVAVKSTVEASIEDC